MSVAAIDVVLPSTEEIEGLVGAEHDSALWALELIRRKVEAAIADVVEHADRTAHFSLMVIVR